MNGGRKRYAVQVQRFRFEKAFSLIPASQIKLSSASQSSGLDMQPLTSITSL